MEKKREERMFEKYKEIDVEDYEMEGGGFKIRV